MPLCAGRCQASRGVYVYLQLLCHSTGHSRAGDDRCPLGTVGGERYLIVQRAVVLPDEPDLGQVVVPRQGAGQYHR